VIGVLHKKNTGKYFSKDYLNKRNAGLVDRRNLSESELAYADISFPDGGGRFDKCTHVLYSVFKGKKYDRRDSPRVGD
jgi:hypothetical protein